MDVQFLNFDYKDKNFHKSLEIVVSDMTQSVNVDIKLGKVDEEIIKKNTSLSKIVRIVMCNKVVPQFVAKKNYEHAKKKLNKALDGVIDQAKFKLQIPSNAFLIRVYINKKVINYTGCLKVVDSDEIPYSVGFCYGVKNKYSNTYDCTEYKSFIYTLQNYLKEEFKKKRKYEDLISVGLSIDTGLCYLNLKNKKSKRKKKFTMRKKEFPTLSK